MSVSRFPAGSPTRFPASAASGSGGAGFLPSDLSNLVGWYTIDPEFTREASNGTGSPPSIGDPIGYIEDRSGAGRHWTQSTTADKALLQQDGSGNYYLDIATTDHYDDTLSESPFTGTGAHTIALSGRFDNVGSGGDIYSVDGGPSGGQRNMTTEAGLRVSSGFRTWDEAFNVGNHSVVWTNETTANTDNAKCFKDGTQLGVDSTSVRAMNTGIARAMLMHGLTGSSEMYGLVLYTDELSEENRNLVEAYISELYA